MQVAANSGSVSMIWIKKGAFGQDYPCFTKLVTKQVCACLSIAGICQQGDL
jgi:hypothetical protein